MFVIHIDHIVSKERGILRYEMITFVAENQMPFVMGRCHGLLYIMHTRKLGIPRNLGDKKRSYMNQTVQVLLESR